MFSIIFLFIFATIPMDGRWSSAQLGAVWDTGVKIINYVNENFGQEGYRFMYSTDDDTVREEKGEFVNGIWTVTGLVKWVSPDKKTEHTVKYKADDKGYQAEQETRSLSPGVIASLGG